MRFRQVWSRLHQEDQVQERHSRLVNLEKGAQMRRDPRSAGEMVQGEGVNTVLSQMGAGMDMDMDKGMRSMTLKSGTMTPGVETEERVDKGRNLVARLQERVPCRVP